MYLQEPERPHELGRPLGHPIFTLLAGFRRIIYPIKIRILQMRFPLPSGAKLRSPLHMGGRYLRVYTAYISLYG